MSPGNTNHYLNIFLLWQRQRQTHTQTVSVQYQQTFHLLKPTDRQKPEGPSGMRPTKPASLLDFAACADVDTAFPLHTQPLSSPHLINSEVLEGSLNVRGKYLGDAMFESLPAVSN